MIESTLDFEASPLDSAQQLLADLSQVRDFPSLSHVISQVNHFSSSETSRTNELTEAILKDVALTNKLLRIVNSAQFGLSGSRAVNTVSRAIVILGFNAIRDVALSLLLFEHLRNHSQARDLQGEAIESFFCGLLGRALAAQCRVKDVESVLICALFRNLGRMICRLHFYDKGQAVDALMAREDLSEEVASRRIFGISYDEFAQVLGKHWHLPSALLQGMAPLPAGPIKPPVGETGMAQLLANMAHEVYQGSKQDDPDAVAAALAAVSKRYRHVVDLTRERLVEIVRHASDVMQDEARSLNIDLQASPFLTRLTAEGDPLLGHHEDDLAEFGTDSQAGEDPTSILVAGLQDITGMLLEDAKPAELLQVAAELIFRAKCFDHVLISTITPSGKELVGRIAFGPNAEAVRQAAHITLSFAPDVFHAAVSKGADLLISDAEADNIRNRIPAWFRERVGAKSFLLLPIQVNGRSVALIYADRQTVSMALPPQTLTLIKAVRNQITLALRQTQTH